jgi:Na+-translocating ferredoxin:NAD+ oxidoreductase subunit G
MKIFKTALVLTLIGIVCGILIGLSNQITAPIIAENERKAELKAYSALFPGLDEANKITVTLQGTIYEVLEVKDGGQTVGYIYKGRLTNSYGVIDQLVGIKKNGEITGIQFLNLDQTPSMKPAIETNALVFKGLNANDINLTNLVVFSSNANVYDTAAGSSFGSTTMRTILRDAINQFKNAGPVVVDPYQDIFGAYATKENDASFTATDKVTKREIIKDASNNVIGYAYTLTSIKNTGTGSNLTEYIKDQDWNLSLLVGVNASNQFLGIEILSSQHTKTFIEMHLPYFESLKGVSVATYNSVDTISGASASLAHIQELLNALQGVL